jgi:hypothetical protein
MSSFKRITTVRRERVTNYTQSIPPAAASELWNTLLVLSGSRLLSCFAI